MAFFTFDERAVQPFVLFSQAHIITLIVLCLIYMLLYWSRSWFKEEKIDKIARYIIASTLILQEISLNLYRLTVGSWSVASSLPLHLCSLLVLLSAVLLVSKSYRLYEFVYLLGIAGASQALLTPSLAEGFPHYGFYQFFISHGLIIFSALYMTFVHDYRPTLKSIYRTFIALNLSLPVIGLIDYITGGDYFFLASKPDTASLLDYLGPWPWYILSLEFVAIILLFFSYSLFKLKKLSSVVRRNAQED